MKTYLLMTPPGFGITGFTWLDWGWAPWIVGGYALLSVLLWLFSYVH
jgi:hypothetical protein